MLGSVSEGLRLLMRGVSTSLAAKSNIELHKSSTSRAEIPPWWYNRILGPKISLTPQPDGDHHSILFLAAPGSWVHCQPWPKRFFLSEPFGSEKAFFSNNCVKPYLHILGSSPKFRSPQTLSSPKFDDVLRIMPKMAVTDMLTMLTSFTTNCSD